MSAVRRPRPGAVLLWFGLFGAPAAWTVLHVTGYALTEATCNEAGRAGWDIHLDAWTIAVTATAFAVAAASGVAAVLVYRRTRDAGPDPPAARVRFLSIVALTIVPLFLCLILMSGLGAVFIGQCRQS